MMAVFFPFVDYDHPLAPPEEVAAYEARKTEIEAEIQPLQRTDPRRSKSLTARLRSRKAGDVPRRHSDRRAHAPKSSAPGQKLLAAQVLSIRPCTVTGR